MLKSLDGGASWSGVNNGLPVPLDTSPGECLWPRLYISPSAPTTLYFLYNCALYRTTNGGANWTLQSSGIQGHIYRTLAISPQNPSLLFAGTTGRNATAGAIFRSTDGGVSWQASFDNPGPIGLAFYTGLVIDPVEPTRIYVASLYNGPNGVLKSEDGGSTWRASNDGQKEWTSIAIDPQSPGVLYLGGYLSTGVYKSTNSGGSWSRIMNGLPTDPGSDAIENPGMYVDPSDSQKLFLVNRNGFGDARIYRSTNAGSSWSLFHTGLENAPGSNSSSVAFSSADPDSAYVGRSGGIFRSGTAEPPVFSEEPLNQRVRPGTSVSLDAIAGGGGGPYSYQWYRGERGDISQPIPGATGRVYTTPPLNVDSSFWVRLSNPAGSVDSRTARVSIKGAYDVALDGFALRNDYRYTPGRAINGASWDIFKRTFPATSMNLPGGTPRFGALRVFQSDQYQQIGLGSCAGFSAISMLRYLDSPESVERDLLNPYYRRFTQIADLPPIVNGDVTVGRSNVKDYLFLYQGRQLSIQWQAWRSRHANATPAQTFDAVRQITQAGNVAMLEYFYERVPKKWSGHASVAYRTEQAGSIGYIYIYDPNWPGDATRRVTVDLGANRWLYELWPGEVWSGSRHLRYLPVSMLFPAALDLPEPGPAALATENAGITIGVDGNVDLLITDSSGRQIGPDDLDPSQEISGAVRLVQISYNPTQPDASSPEAYYLPAGQTYTVTVQLAASTGPALATSAAYTLTAFGDGSALAIGGASLAAGQADTLRLDGSVRDSAFTPAGDSDYCQALTDEISDVNSREYRACVSDAAGVPASFSIDATGAYRVRNVGTRPIDLALSTEQVGALTGFDTVTESVAPGQGVVAPEPLARLFLPLLRR